MLSVKRLVLFSAFVLCWCFAQATVHVNMFSSPVVLVLNHNYVARAFYVADSATAITFVVAVNGSNEYMSFTDGGHSFFTEHNPGPEDVATQLNCADTMATDSVLWSPQATIGDTVTGYNFNGKGPRYLGFKEIYGNGYVYGWFKISSSLKGDSLIIYGFGYNDQVSDLPNIIAGEGECISGIADVSLPAVSVQSYMGSIQLSAPEPLLVNLYDMQGRSVNQWHFNGGYAEYNCNQLAHGVYIVRASKGGQQKTVKVVL